MEEIWKDVVGYEGLYQVSNYGRVKSLGRVLKRDNQWGDHEIIYPEKILKPGKSFDSNNRGYNLVVLYALNGDRVTFLIHKLAWETFNGKVPAGLEIDHINNNKDDCSLSNLQLLTCRKNITKRYKQSGKKTSRFTGVHWSKFRSGNGKWRASININGKQKQLGSFVCESLAALAYQKALISAGIL